jgi:hypothetical protein
MASIQDANFTLDLGHTDVVEAIGHQSGSFCRIPASDVKAEVRLQITGNRSSPFYFCAIH